jgi:hypothetical protein
MIILAPEKRESLVKIAVLLDHKPFLEKKQRKIIETLYDYPLSDFCPVLHLECPCFGQLCLALLTFYFSHFN